MKTILKFPITADNLENIIEMPVNAKIVHVGYQDEILTMWAECDTESAKERHKFDIFGTGQKIVPENAKHIHSWLESVFVWHLYDVTEVAA